MKDSSSATQSGTGLLVAWVVVALGALGVVAVAAQEVPLPDLSSTEPRVRAAIERSHEEVRSEQESATLWGEYAMLLEAHGHLDEARLAYREAARLDPEEFLWPYLLGALIDFSDPAQAIGWLEKALDIDAAYAPAWVRYGESLEKLGREEQAREAFERATRLDDRDALAHLGLGRMKLRSGDTTGAVKELERAYQLAPEVQAVVATLARAYHRAGRPERARELAEESRGLPRLRHRHDPRRAAVHDAALNVESYLRRARTYMETGQATRALAELDRLQEIEPDHVGALVLETAVFDSMGDPERAASSAQRALEIEPDNVAARAMYAGSLAKLQRFGEARREADLVLAVDPDNFRMLVVSAMLDAQDGDVAALMGRLDRAFEVRTDDRPLRSLLGNLLINTGEALDSIGQKSEAAVRFEQALQLAREEGAPAAETTALERRIAALRSGGG